MLRKAFSVTLRSHLTLGAAAGIGYVASSSSSSSTCASAPTGPWTLRYFPVPGAPGEIVRLMLVLSGEDWEDKVTGAKSSPPWSAIKKQAKFGQMPLLTSSDGTDLAQSRAIARFLAQKVTINSAPLRPADPWLCFQADELVDALEDVRNKVVKTFAIKDQAEKEAARGALFAKGGDMHAGFSAIDKLVGSNGSANGYMLGDTFSLADLWCFIVVNQFRAGFLDGIPTDGWIDDMPELKAVVENVAAIPAVKAYYSGKAKKSGLFAAFIAK